MINKLFCASLLLLTFFAAHIIFPAQMTYAASLHLAWNGNTEDDLAGYKIYYGTSPGIYGFSYVLGDVTEYELSGLEEEVRYYIALSAFDYSNNESEKSAEMSGMPYPSTATSSTTTINPTSPVTTTPTPATTTTRPVTTTTSIQPDITPPTGKIIINQGAATTDCNEVTLYLSAEDDESGMGEGAQMMFSKHHKQQWSDPMPFEAEKQWTLSPGKGQRTIYAKFCDAAGNCMDEPVSDAIMVISSCPNPRKLNVATLESSSTLPARLSEHKIVDNNTNTGWLSPLRFFQRDESITIDLGETKTVNRVDISSNLLRQFDLFPHDFEVQASTDNEHWVNLFTVENYSPPSSRSESWTFEEIETRYIRMVITRSKRFFLFFHTAYIADIAVYGCTETETASTGLALSTSPDQTDTSEREQTQQLLRNKGFARNATFDPLNESEHIYKYETSGVICDNGSPFTSLNGIWDASDEPDSYGGTSLISCESGTHTWTPDLLKEGYYQLYMWWSSSIANCSSCPVEVSCDGGLIDTLYVDQQQDGGQWHLLGSYNLESGNACSVTITSEDSNIKACADAVKFVYRGESLPEVGIDFIFPNPAYVDEEVCFEGNAIPAEGKITEDYSWVSDLDGEISTNNSFCTSSLSEGTHRITFKVQTEGNIWSAPAEQMVSITNSPPFPQDIWLEAEEGIINPPMEADGDNGASAGEYIWIPDTLGNALDSTRDSGYAEYDFEVLEAGDFVVWGRVIANSSQDDSFFVSMDGGAYSLWDTLRGGEETWVWDQVSDRRTADPVIFTLDAGIHTLVIKQREDGTKLDRILITNDRAYDPLGPGE